jgi:two-component system sensor histidine kinase YesM
MKRPPTGLLKFYRNLPIRNKLVLVLYIQILIPLILIGYLSYKNSEGIIMEKSTAYSRDILNMIQLRLNDYIENLTDISQDLLYDNKIYDVLNTSPNVVDPLRWFENENMVNSHLKMVVISRDEIRAICIYDSKGKTYYAEDNSRDAKSKGDVPYPEMLKEARLHKGKPFIFLVTEGRRVNDIYVVRQINDRDSFSELGLMVMQVKTEVLDQVYQGLTGNLQNILILSSDNKLIAGRDINDPTIFSDVLMNNIKGDKGAKIDSKAGLFVSYLTLKSAEWKVVAYVAIDELYKDAYALRRNIIMLCLVCVLLLSFITTIIALDFVNPINKLVKGMKKVQAGESNVYIQVDREDELGFLNKAFNEMSGEIHHLVNWVYREQLTRKEAELKALQSQINPHFLFNTLEAINWMAQLNNVPEISSTVSDLSDLMEASIGRDDRLISISEEFTYADKYISLQKRRFGDRIELIKNVQEEAAEIKIPRLLIQPLVENAVYHGVERIRGTGIVKLNAFKTEDKVSIEVIDNGAGMNRDELEQLNERLSMDNDTYFKKLGEKKSKSIGIENVNRRIKLFYGENYGLVIESEEGNYTKATVTIPCDTNAGREGFYVQSADNR